VNADPKRCPFCGERAQTNITDGIHSIGCINPDCEATMDGFSTEADAIDAWNLRDEIVRLQEGMREIAKCKTPDEWHQDFEVRYQQYVDELRHKEAIATRHIEGAGK